MEIHVRPAAPAQGRSLQLILGMPGLATGNHNIEPKTVTHDLIRDLGLFLDKRGNPDDIVWRAKFGVFPP